MNTIQNSDFYYKTKELSSMLKVGTTRDKFDAVKKYSDIIGEKVEMTDKEIKLSVQGKFHYANIYIWLHILLHIASLDKVNEMNDMIIQSIKNKLSLLNQMDDK